MKLIVIGTSAGGINALQLLLLGLPRHFKTPIVVVQHLPDQARVDLNLLFSRNGSFRVVEVDDKMPIEDACIYCAPPGYHLLIERSGHFALNLDEPVNFSRPSIDVCFESAATAFGKEITGILMTGASKDGALGLAKIHLRGGFTLVQDPESAEVAVMPRSAIELFEPSYVGSIAEIAKLLCDRLEVHA